MASTLQNIAVSILFKAPPAAKAPPADAPPPSYNGLTYTPPSPTPPAAPKPPPRPPHPNAHLPRRFPWRAAAIQCASLLVSALALALTAFVVWVFDGNPAQTFHADVVAGWRQSVTLNTVVAWLAAVARTALLLPVAECVGQLKWVVFGRGHRRVSDLDYVDWAARDVVGAAAWILRFRRGLLVHFGAALMIVAVGVDPLLQQLLTYDLRSVADTTQPALLAHNPSYTPTRGFSRGLLLATPRALLWGATAAVLGGAPVTTTHSCPSGNCTFPATTSVGVCSTCTDITAALTRNCTALTPAARFCQSADCFDAGQLCTYTYNGTAVGGGTAFLAVNAAGTNSSARSSATGTVAIPATRIRIAALYIQPANSSGTQDLPVAPGYVAPGAAHVARGYTCALSFCEQTYAAAVRDGRYAETLQATASLAEFVVPVPASAAGITDALLNQAVPLAASGATTVSLAALFGMSSGLSVSLTGNASVPAALPRPGDISEFHRALYVDLLAEDFGAAMARMAESMSAAVRNEGAAAAVNGTAYVLESYTRARWAWFAFPAAVWVLAAVLVGGVLARTWADRGGWLGSSVCAVLLLGVEEAVRRRVDAGGAVVKRDEVSGGLGVWRDSLSVRRVADEFEMRTEIVQEGGVLAMRLKEKVK